jgi:hypothetical protein
MNQKGFEAFLEPGAVIEIGKVDPDGTIIAVAGTPYKKLGRKFVKT